MTNPHPDERSGEFLSYMLKSQRAVRNYLFSLHPRAQDLDDLLQETALTLWREFDKFDRGREFLPWALRIAYFEVLRFRKKQSRDRLVFSEEFLELLDAEAEVAAPAQPALRALEVCLAKLDARSHEVLMARYSEGGTVAELAARRRDSVHRLYRLLERARLSVVTCVRRQLHLGGNPLAS